MDKDLGFIRIDKTLKSRAKNVLVNLHTSCREAQAMLELTGVDSKANFITNEDIQKGTVIPLPRLVPKEEDTPEIIEHHKSPKVINPREDLRRSMSASIREKYVFDPHDTCTHEQTFGNFDKTMLYERIDKFWQRYCEFGVETMMSHNVLSEIVSDRYTLTHGFQLIRDELQFAGFQESQHEDQQLNDCGADCSIPSVVSTLAYTNCGDRFNSEVHQFYKDSVGTRFSTISELGSLKTEAFYPTGGGTDDGKTLSHVTIAHMLNDNLKKVIYEGNASSYPLVAFDLFTHCGKSSDECHVSVGLASESEWRDQRAACGAIVGCLKAFNSNNPVHKRLRSDLDNGVTKINYLVAAAIVAIQGMINTAVACVDELDERGCAHLTASVCLNKKSATKGLFSMYFGRAIVCQKQITMQAFGTDATKYSGILVKDGNRNRFQLFYDGKLDVPVAPYTIPSKNTNNK